MNKKKSKQDDLDFSEFDSLFAEVQETIRQIDTPTIPAQSPRTVVRPSITVDNDIQWDRRLIELRIVPEWQRTIISLSDFYGLLSIAARFFVWNKFEVDGKSQLLRGWDKEGSSYDPVTAVMCWARKEHYNLCVTDCAAKLLGLSDSDSLAIAVVCWNAEFYSEDISYLEQIRTDLIRTITEGLSHGE